MKSIALVISCEHAVRAIPDQYVNRFEPFQDLLETHAAIDFGALEIAEYFVETLQCDFVQAKTSRLLVDCNRSVSHPQCFSKVTEHLSPVEKQKLLKQYYFPYRKQVIDLIEKHIKRGSKVLHLSMHSFIPVLHGIVRQTDIGLLYDPKRAQEKQFAQLWKAEFNHLNSNLRFRRNYPYKGTSDGFTTALRKLFGNEVYLGIEVETNQALVKEKQSLTLVKKLLLTSLITILER